MRPLAVIADVHGNRWALSAVLEDLDRQGISRVVNLGDSLYGPLDPAGTADLLLEREYPTVGGNEDRILVDPGSVGLPAYSDDQPVPHVMETGTPHARYAVIVRSDRGFSITERAVPYDWRSAVETALANGRPD